jgi:outer membrane lipoprotein-sorting protein
MFPLVQAQALTIEEVASHVGKEGVIRAEFTQTRKLTALKRPVISTGKVIVAGGQGIIWQIDHPYRASYIITRDSMVELDREGRRKGNQGERAQQFRQISKLISSLLTLNDKGISENFDVTITGDVDRWSLTLVSRESLARFIAKVSMQGGAFVDEVTIVETSGDTSNLQFHAAQKNGSLTQSELRLIQGY